MTHRNLQSTAWKTLVWSIIVAGVANLIYQLVLTWHSFDSLVQARPVLVVAAILNQVVAYGVLVPSMGRFYEHCGIRLTQWRVFALISAGLASSRIIPAGEYLVWRVSLKRRRGGVGATTQWFVLYAIAMNLSLAVLFMFTELATMVLYPQSQGVSLVDKLRYVPVAAVVVVGLIVAALRVPRFRAWVIRHAFDRISDSKALSPGGIVRERQLDRQDAWWMSFASFGTWLIEGYTLYLCFASLGLRVPLIMAIAGYCFARLIANLPLSPGGIGEMEASAALFFAAYGYPIGLVVTGTFLHRLITYWPPVLIGALAYALAGRHGEKERINLGLQPFAEDIHERKPAVHRPSKVSPAR